MPPSESASVGAWLIDERPGAPQAAAVEAEAATAWYVTSSHWDREWYATYQAFRARLADLMDGVLDSIARGDATGPFYCDGQAVMLEDFLALRPDRRDELAAALRGGQVVAGPFYVLPDEFLVSGESMIRNLERGRALVRSFGARPSDAGFLCDLFGHHSQMPQVLKGFGIDGGLIWRGVNASKVRHVRWIGADGTELPCYRFGTNGYWGFAVKVAGFTQRVNDPDVPPLEQRLTAYLDDEALRTEIDDVLLFHGPDHVEPSAAWHREIGGLIGQRVGDAGHVLRHGSLDDYLRSLLSQTDRISTTVTGELLDPGRERIAEEQQWLIAGTLASRVWIKQANSRAQALLCQWAEPWACASGLVIGRDAAPPAMLDEAWRYLLLNHPHDSICGCSIDAVHDDMRHRFRQSIELAEIVTDRSLAAVADRLPAVEPGRHRLVFFNPSPRSRREIVELDVEVPTDWPMAERFNWTPEPRPNFRLLDPSGREIAFQRLGHELDRSRVTVRPDRAPLRERAHRVRLAAELDLPPMGWLDLRLAPENGRPSVNGASHGPGLVTGPRSMGNDLLDVTVEPTGTLRIDDQRTGQTYANLMAFESGGDVGDGWNYEPPQNDRVVGSPGCPHTVSVIVDGPLMSKLRVRYAWPLPEWFDKAAQRRSDAAVEQIIEVDLTLRRGAERLEVACRLDHRVRDHRLRVLFPTGCDSDVYLADTPFDVVERSIALRPDNDDYREPEVETKPQQSWTGVCGPSDRGLAVVAAGLMEATVRDLPDRPIALTLLRATERTVFTDGEPGGQVIGPQAFRFDIVPQRDGLDRTALTEHGQAIHAPARWLQRWPGDAPRRDKTTSSPLPSRSSVFELHGPTVLSSLRRVPSPDDRGAYVEARLFNPESRPIEAWFALPLLASRQAHGASIVARAVDFEGRPADAGNLLRRRDGWTLELGAKQVMTVRVTLTADEAGRALG